jgi:hypothetical protein
MKCYTYYIVYSYNKGSWLNTDYGTVTLKTELNDLEDINAIMKRITEGTGHENPVIINWKLLKVKEIPEEAPE